MKNFILPLLLLSITFSALAKEPSKGYRGFVEWNMDFGSFDTSTMAGVHYHHFE